MKELFLVLGLVGMMSAIDQEALGADYTSPTLGTDQTAPRDLVLENVQILSELPLSGSRMLVEVAARIRNMDSFSQWVSLNTGLTPEIPGFYDILYLSSSIIFDSGTILAGQIATNTGAAPYISVLVETAEASAAVAEVLSGTIITVTAETVAGVIVDTLAQLPPVNIRIIEQIALPNGMTLLRFTTDVHNLTTEALRKITVLLNTSASSINYTIPRPTMDYATGLGPSETEDASSPMYLDVDAFDLETLRSNILSGAGLQISGKELWVFNAQPRGIDSETEAAWQFPGSSTLLIFTNVTTFLQNLAPGDLLLEDPGVHHLRANAPDNPADPFDDDDPVLADYLPFEVTSVTVTGNEVRVAGEQKRLLEILKSGTLIARSIDAYDSERDPYDPELENTYTQEEQEERRDAAAIIEATDPRDRRLADLKGMTAIPWHFNDTFLSEKIKVSGELLFRLSPLRLEFRIRDFKVDRAAARMEAGAVLNLLIEATGSENTSNKLAFEKEKDLTPQGLGNLPPLTFNLGGVPVSVQPEVSLRAGVEANIPVRLTVPLQSSFSVGMEMGFDRSLKNATNDGFYYLPFTDIVPIRVSDPTVFDDLAATLGAWAEVGVGLKIGVGEGLALQAGPSLAVRLVNDFTLAPLANPWWSFDSGIDLIGRFQMNVDFLGEDILELVDAEGSLAHFPIFHRDAGGGLLSPHMLGPQYSSGLEPVVGANERWGRLLLPTGGAGPFNSPVLLKLANSSDLIIAGGTPGSVGRFDREGNVLWSQNLGIGAQPTCGVALPDGSFTLAGPSFSSVFVANYAGDGTRNWTVTLSGGRTVEQVVLGQNAQGQPEYYLVGHLARGSITRSDPEVIKLDAAGTIVWAKTYDLAGYDDEAHGAILTSDGNLVLSGRTGYPVAPPPFGTADPANILKTGCALLMKISATDGSLLWARNYPSRWGLSFDRVVEAPDGTLFAAGSAGRVVTQDRPSNLFAKFNADGTLIAHVTVGEDGEWEDELPTAGSTPYDTATQLIWTEEGLWACGVTGAGDGAAGWVMGLTDELGVRFFSVFDGPTGDSLLNMIDTGESLVAIGNTGASYPWGVGGLTVPMLLNLPWEGIMRFHPDSKLKSLFLQPRVYKSSADLDFIIFSYVDNPGAGRQYFGSWSGSVPFVVNSTAVQFGSPIAAASAITNYTTYAIEAVDAGLVQDYSTWAAYHLLGGLSADPYADPDGDGLANYMEAYFARNPWIAEVVPILSILASETNGTPTATIQFERSNFGRFLNVQLQSTEGLAQWTNAVTLSETIHPIDDTKERVSIATPRDVPARFFRAAGFP